MGARLVAHGAHADDPDLVATMTHPSNPDQLMARALGVCWHSPTSDRWPCQEPLADWEREFAHREFRAAHQTCGCDQDPIECNHEAALSEVEEKLRRIRELLAFLNSNDPTFVRYERYFLRALGDAEIRCSSCTHRRDAHYADGCRYVVGDGCSCEEFDDPRLYR